MVARDLFKIPQNAEFTMVDLSLCVRSEQDTGPERPWKCSWSASRTTIAQCKL